MMVDYVREMTVKKSCKYGRYGLFEHLLFLFAKVSYYRSLLLSSSSDLIIIINSFFCHLILIPQTLARDLESREKQAAKAITQLKETSDKLEETERQKAMMTQQLEDVTKKLSDVSKELEKTLQELRGTQLSLQDAEKKKDEFKGRAQETVRQ